MPGIQGGSVNRCRQGPCSRQRSAAFYMGIYSDFMGFYIELMGFDSDLMGFYSDSWEIIVFYSDLEGFV
jgi:hypothetical protein